MFLKPAFWLGVGVVVAYEFLPHIVKAARPVLIQTMKAGMAASDQLKMSGGGLKETFEDMMAEARTQYEAEKGAAAQQEQPRPAQ